MQVSDAIELFIKSLLTEGEQAVELRRNELAVYFRCAPSQINYVLSTRFTVDRGYIIESRRGGGGFIRIARLDMGDDEQFLKLMHTRVGEAVSLKEAVDIIRLLGEKGWADIRQARLMAAAINDEALSLPLNAKDRLRAGILKSMLKAVMMKGKERIDDEM